MAGPTPSILSEAEQIEQSLLAISDDYDDLPLRTSSRGCVLRKPNVLSDYVTMLN